jgi:hypothetical protein
MNILNHNGPDLENLATTFPGLSFIGHIGKNSYSDSMKQMTNIHTQQVIEIEHNKLPINRLQELLRNLSRDSNKNPKLFRTKTSFWDKKHPDYTFFRLSNSEWLDIGLSFNEYNKLPETAKKSRKLIVLTKDKSELLGVVKKFYLALFSIIKKETEKNFEKAGQVFIGARSITFSTIRKHIIKEFKKEVEVIILNFEEISDLSNVSDSDKRHFKGEMKKLGNTSCEYEFVISPAGFFGTTTGQKDSFIKNSMEKMGFIFDKGKEKIKIIENNMEYQQMDSIELNLNRILEG